jgi:4a-hydroxytetrahydrobiopterin dehydratase
MLPAMRPAPLSPSRLKAALRGLPGWTGRVNGLAKTFTFADFRTAFAFMTQVAFAADRMDHHPEWTNVYNRVTVRLNTHSAGGRVTALDVALARQIEAIAPPPTPAAS